MAATRRRWLAALQLSTAAYLFVVLYHAVQMGELRCLLADQPAFGEACRLSQPVSHRSSLAR